ncbi:hypothetical protein BH23BAC1_BH23BAC1_28300 [soil metagenome]
MQILCCLFSDKFLQNDFFLLKILLYKGINKISHYEIVKDKASGIINY